MSKFNKNAVGSTRTTNLAGGAAYKQTPELELVSILLTSFVQDQYYRSANDTMARVTELLGKVNPKFAAKAAVYARNEFKMRSITHVLAGELAKYVSGQSWAKNFYKEIARRPDDMTEIVSYYFSKGNKKLPNSLKKGFAKAFDNFDGYQIAKYRGEGKDVSLIDLVNMVHPIPTEKNQKALEDLVNGVLKSTDTWESKMTKAGQEATSSEDKAERKSQAWYELLSEKKMPAMALVRNLRNILEQSQESVDLAIAALKNENYIKNSMMLPFRFIAAINELEKVNFKRTGEVIAALNVSLDHALSNVPVFQGRTLVVLDDSGSMTWKATGDYKNPMQIGSLFASVLVKTNNCDFMMFNDRARYINNMNFADSVGTLTKKIMEKATSGGTNFQSIFQAADKAYDRVIILSDMQNNYSGNGASALNEYKRRTGANPNVYSFDLQNYGTMQFPQPGVYCIAGFSESVFDVMKMLEQDKKALIKTIENYTQFED